MRKYPFFRLLTESYENWRDPKISNLAAALSFYMTFSMPPLLIICVSVAGLVFGKDIAQKQILNQIAFAFGTDSANEIQVILMSANKHFNGILATVTGVVITLFSAAGVFSQMQDGVNMIWEVQPKPGRSLMNMINDRFFSFAMVLGVAFLLLVSLIINTVIISFSQYMNAILPGGANIWLVLNFIGSLAVVTVLFSLIFKILPDVVLKWRDVMLGAFLTAIMFNLGKFVLAVYLAKTDISTFYGSAGSFIVILIWIYYSAQLLFFGVEFTKVSTVSRKKLVPTKNAIHKVI